MKKNTTKKHNADDFAGDKKVGASVLSPLELRLKNWLVPKVPLAIETWHLTLTTLLWCALVVLFGYFARDNLAWLWAISLMIVCQYITDLLDGEVGRRRNTGLVKWGFYMDHFLDYIFLCCLVLAGYLFAPPQVEIWYIVLMVLAGGFMVNSFLLFAATNQFEIYQFGMGPTEARLGLIGINAWIAIFGTDDFPWLLPVACAVCLFALIVNSWQIHRRLWALDMQLKEQERS